MTTSIVFCFGALFVTYLLRFLIIGKFKKKRQMNEITNIDGTGLWTDSKPEGTYKSSSVHLRKKCATNVTRCWQKRNSDQFSSDENSPTYKRSVSKKRTDDEDIGIMDDMLTSESESSSKIRRRQKKKPRFRKIREKCMNYENKENIPNKGKISQDAEDFIPSKNIINDRLMIEMKRFRAITPPLRQHIKLNLPEDELVSYLNHYLLNANDLKAQGYAYKYKSKAGFFKKPFSGRGGLCTAPVSSINFDVNAREFVPSYKKKIAERKLSCDSGQASGGTSSSSAASTDSELSDNIAEWKINENTERTCVRCRREFHVDEFGEYLRSERCTYHWGKFEYNSFGGKYSCCKSEKHSKGCSIANEHVWNGYEIGFNGPLDNFVDTANSCNTQQMYKVFALDCEMCYTSLGLECTKVTLVRFDGHKVYEKFIRPSNEIICYNTRFSGITKKHLISKNGSVATLHEVQQDLLEYIGADTILIGHALENDLRVLKMIHNKVIDTSVCFPHPNGSGFKHSLRTLTQQYLKRSIQDSDQGHSSFEDSRAALELMLWRVRRDFRAVLEQ